MPQTGTLPRDVADMRSRAAAMFTSESYAAGHAYKADPGDVIIATYPKCGTTLMQQIVHGLRTGGDMDFGEITEVVPWLETSLDMDVDVYAPQKARPHVFKSHQSWENVPKGAKYIYIMRDPKDVVVSFFHFFEGWMFKPGTIGLNEFVRDFLLAGTSSGAYAAHYCSWWHKRNDADTLMLCYEDIVAGLAGTVARVNDFTGINASAQDVAIATRQANIDFMREHGTKFDDHPLRSKRNPVVNLPPSAVSTKVRSGKVGSHKAALDETMHAHLDALWRELLAPTTGHDSYASLRASLAP
jgi:hypothetical protein